MKPRKYPVFTDRTIAEWLEGHQERVYAVVGAFTFSLTLKGRTVVRIEKYDRPERIPAGQYEVQMPPNRRLSEYLLRWSQVFTAKQEIKWDDAVTGKTEVVA